MPRGVSREKLEQLSKAGRIRPETAEKARTWLGEGTPEGVQTAGSVRNIREIPIPAELRDPVRHPVFEPDTHDVLIETEGKHPGQIVEDQRGRRFFRPAYGPIEGQLIEMGPGAADLGPIQEFAAGPPGATRQAPDVPRPPMMAPRVARPMQVVVGEPQFQGQMPAPQIPGLEVPLRQEQVQAPEIRGLDVTLAPQATAPVIRGLDVPLRRDPDEEALAAALASKHNGARR